MFSHNIRRLGLNLIRNVPRTAGRPGRLCLVLLPTVQKWPSVNFSSAKSSEQFKKQENTDDQEMAGDEDFKDAKSVYDFTVKDTYGNDVSLDKYKGHVLVIVNIASQCGLTKNNYKKLTELKEKYYDKGLRILSFPCNQFGSQMPEADGEEMVCHLKSENADVGDVFQKVDVNGKDAHPLFKYLKHKQGGTLTSALKWNFTKFLVDKNGQVVDRFAPTTDPLDISKRIDELL